MQKNPGHQPQRFIEYTQVQDGSGFTIKGSDHFFKYDENKGWEDEYGNYYDAQGKPIEDQDDQSYDSKSVSDEQDEFQKKYGSDAKATQEFENEPVHSEVIERIARNMTELEHHQKLDPLRINFEILDIEADEFPPTLKELFYCYKQKVKGILNVLNDSEEQGENHTGYFVVKDAESAQQLIALQGKDLLGFDISFDIQSFEELLNDPLSQSQLENNFPKLVSLNSDEQLCILSLESETGGFHCGKNQFIQWLKQFGLNKDNIEKMIKDDDHTCKKPVLKIKIDDLAKFKDSVFQDKKVIVEQYKVTHKKKKMYKQKTDIQEKHKTEEKKHEKEEKVKEKEKEKQTDKVQHKKKQQLKQQHPTQQHQQLQPKKDESPQTGKSDSNQHN